MMFLSASCIYLSNIGNIIIVLGTLLMLSPKYHPGLNAPEMVLTHPNISSI